MAKLPDEGTTYFETFLHFSHEQVRPVSYQQIIARILLNSFNSTFYLVWWNCGENIS
jgi:hypothetical protein